MKKSILLVAVLMALVSLCLVFAGCDSDSSDSDDPTPPPVPTYTISFAAGEGTGSMEPVTVEKGASYTIKANGFTAPAGTLRIFESWNTVEDGSGIEYAAEGTIQEVTADITLYAQWTKPLFSVSETKKVYFAKGNLQATYTGSAYTWGFAANQYSYVGNAPGNTSIDSQTNNAVVDLFGWVGDNGTLSEYGISTSTTPNDYGTSATETLKKDWGTAIDNAGTWRTLSSAEWKYLLNTDGSPGRSDANRFAKANVNEVKGLVIFPDGYILPSGYTTASGGTGMAKVNKTSSTDAPFPTDSIPAETWTAMENAGVVFLPAAGYRSGSSVNYVGSNGYYWSSTPISSSNSAYLLYFRDSLVNPAGSNSRGYGYSVRLVCGE